MSKKIHTIQSSDKKEFDKQVNQLLELGGELMDGGYQVINSDDGIVYSQVMVFKKNREVEFSEDGKLKSVRNKNEDGQLDGLYTEWYWRGQKYSEGNYKEEFRDGKWTYWHENGQKYQEGTYKEELRDGLWTVWRQNGKKHSEITWKDGKRISKFFWDEDGNEKDCK